MKKFCLIMTAVMLLCAVLCGCDKLGAVSDSDAPAEAATPAVTWAQEPSDEAYLDVMNDRISEYINCLTALNSMEKRLSALGDAEKIIADVQFAEISGQLNDWCSGARSYPAETLINDRAKTVCLLCTELAGATEEYIEQLPTLLAGTDGSGLSLTDYQNSIVDSAVKIFQLLNGGELDAQDAQEG